MVCLHVRVSCENDGIHLNVDRLEREDANEQERQVIDIIHDAFADLIKSSPGIEKFSVINRAQALAEGGEG